jgi:hypothetical protein
VKRAALRCHPKRSPNQSTFMGGTLADSDVTKKLKIYHTLYLLNLSFARIVAHCQTLHETGIFKPKFSRLYQAYAQELQAEINDEALDTVTSIEADNMHRFGKVRDARVKELRDPRRFHPCRRTQKRTRQTRQETPPLPPSRGNGE